jgi:hypothetical protein
MSLSKLLPERKTTVSVEKGGGQMLLFQGKSD